jgi:hypothetical protein
MDLRETIKRNGFVFHRISGGWEVYCQGKSIGKIITTSEASGRHAFRLEWDLRQRPRHYRGMVVAAKALTAIASVKQKCRGLCLEAVIIQAWEEKPGGSFPRQR